MHPHRPTRILLIGCGATKLDHEAPARDLYTGSIFRARRTYAEASGCHWWILSGKYGLLSPECVIAPYDYNLAAQCLPDRAAWAVGVAQQLLDLLPDHVDDLRRTLFEIHAGETYADRLRDVLIAVGWNASWPVRGLSQGQLLAFYKAKSPVASYPLPEPAHV